MREIDKIAEGLFEKIRDRFEDVSLGNDKAKATTDPEKARFFNFDYVVNDHNHGNITMSLIDETSLKVYFSKNISKDLDEEERHEWYSFLRELREFARRNLLSFEPRDITRSTLKHRDIAQQSKADSTYDKDEVVAESRMYGTLNRSYESFGPVRIKLAHTKPIMDESHGARSRNIEAVFVENDQGERFRLPFTSLIGARAMARHVSAGGVPTDELGQHITEMVNEMMTLRPFIRGVQRRTFEDTMTKEMIESAFGYHGLLKNTLKKLKGKRGYTEYKETFKPALVEDEANVEELKELFVKKTLDERIEQALPLVHKAHKIMKENNNPFAQQFESWASTVAEGSWALPDTEDEVAKIIDLLSEPLPVGVDAQNATNALYNIIGNDTLFDRLGELADIDPNADARDVIQSWLYDNLPHIYQQIENEIGDPDYPADPAEGEQDINEGVAARHLSDATAKGILDQTIDIYDILAGHTKVQPGEQELLQTMYDDISSDTGYHADDDFEEIIDRMYDYIEHDYGMEEGTYGTAMPGGTQNMLATTMEDKDSQDDDGGVEAVMSAIIRRIAHQHHDLLMKLGPDGVLEAAREHAERIAPVDEIGTSDVSAYVAAIRREAGLDQEETNPLEEAFERLLNEDTINVGDIIHDKTQPEIEGRVIRLEGSNYIINVEGEEYHIAQVNAEKMPRALHEDQVSDKLQSFVGQTFYVPKEGNKGTVSSVADPKRFSNSLVVDLDNGTTTVVHFTDLEATTPGIVKQTLDKLKSVITGGGTPKYQPKSYGSVTGDMKEDILKLAGL